MDVLGEKECVSVLRQALGREDFHLERYSVEPASESPIGFMARHLNLVATVRVEGATRDVRFFVKCPPTSGPHLTYVEEMQHFEKELEMYETVIPKMSDKLPHPFRLPIPRCYLTRGKLIILEDLKEKGYRLWDRMVPFDLDHCRSLMTSLARFHAPSFLLQIEATTMVEGNGETVSSAGGIFRVARDRLLTGSGGEMGRRWEKSSVDTMTTAIVGFWPERFGKKGKEVEGRLWEAWGELRELSKPSEKHTNVLCHGDLWANNVMFRGEGADGPDDAVLVDLQLVRFAPPITDILLFLHTSTTATFRAEHSVDLLRTYHDRLREIVGGATLDQLMPLGCLLDVMEEYGLFGKLVSAIWLSFILNSEKVVPMLEEGGSAGEPPDFVSKILKDRGDEVLLNAQASEVYRGRVMESYRECLEHLGLWK
ncbi:uncharacterized protein [Hetaerina americana]|uniref:uncharacterized protein n=1 Tax=Hetaerina americana TaxID=62018 RepID=UPI003A7F2707